MSRVRLSGLRLGGGSRYRTGAALIAVVAIAVIAGTVARAGHTAVKAGLHAKKNFKIVLIPGMTADPFFITMDKGAKAEAKKLGVTLQWQGSPNYEPSEQIPIVQSVLAEHPDFLIVAPTDGKALIAPIRQFDQAKIPVLTIDSDITKKSLRLGNITSNNITGGEQGAAILSKGLSGHGQVAVLNAEPGITTTDARQAGFVKAIKKYKGIQYVGAEHDADDPVAAAQKASGLLTRYPKLKGFYATDDIQGAGAANAAKQAGRKVKIVAFDAEPDEVTDLKRGLLYALIVQKAYLEGELAVKDAVGYLNGKHHAIPKQTTLKNVIATRKNMNSPAVKKWLYKQ